MVDYSARYNQSTAPKQRGRAIAQGFMLNSADEAEAVLQSLFTNKSYEEALAEIRQAYELYKQQNPNEAMAYEVGGAVAPAAAGLLAAPFTGGSSAVAAGPIMSRVMLSLGLKNPKTLMQTLYQGLSTGAISGFADAEGGFMNRAAEGIKGGVVGTAFSGAVEAAGMLAKPTFAGFIDATRRRFGNRVGGRVEAEVQELVEELGISPDEAVQQILDGRVLADNKTIAEAVRGYRAGAAAASDMAERRLKLRPQQKQEDLIQDVSAYLGGVAQDTGPRLGNQGRQANILQQMTKTLSTLKEQSKALYEGPWADQPVSDAVYAQIRDLFPLAPRAFKDVNEVRRLENLPQIEMKDGQVVMPNTISIKEAEIIRRALSDAKDAAWDAKKGTVADAYERVEAQLRAGIDNISDETRQARAKWSEMKSMDKAFKDGQKYWKATPDPDALETVMLELMAKGDEEALRAFRLGVLTKLRGQLRNQPTGTAKKITKDTTDMSLAFSIVFPELAQTDIKKQMQTLVDSQEAANIALQGSQSEITAAWRQRRGKDIGLADFGMDMVSIVGLGMKIAERMKPDFSDFERKQLVDVLTSSDPQQIRNVLRDDSGMRKFVDMIKKIIEQSQAGARRAGSQQFGQDPKGAVRRGIEFVQ